MVDYTQGFGLDQIADIVNRQHVGASQRARNEMIRTGVQSPDSFAMQNQSSIRQAQQPSETTGLSSLYSKNSSIAPNISSNRGLFDNPEIYDPLYAYTHPDTSGTHSPFSPKLGTPNSILKAGTQPFNSDPIIQHLNTLYDYTPPGQTENAEGWDFTRGSAGSWDLGDKKVLAPVRDDRYAWDGTPATLMDGTDGFMQKVSSQVKPYKDDGGFNPDGWQIRGTKSGALKHILGTASVLLPAVASYWGPILSGATSTGGSAATIGAGSEGMMTGSAATAATAPTVTGGSTGMFGLQALDTGSTALNKAGEGALKGFLFSGGNPKAALQGAVAGPAGSALASFTDPYIGQVASKALGGAASGGLNSLFTSNDPIAGSLFGGISGGLHGYLNSVNQSNGTFNKESSSNNASTANNIVKLARLFARK